MPARIYSRRPPALFLAEWRTWAKLTQEQLGDRLGVNGVTVSRWETGKRRPDLGVLAAFAEALGRHPRDMYRHPEHLTADDLLADQSPEVIAQALKLITAIRR